MRFGASQSYCSLGDFFCGSGQLSIAAFLRIPFFIYIKKVRRPIHKTRSFKKNRASYRIRRRNEEKSGKLKEKESKRYGT
jgi:hypothetical protein